MLMAASGQTRGSHEFIFGQKLGSFSFLFLWLVILRSAGKPNRKAKGFGRQKKVYVEITWVFYIITFVLRPF